MRVCEDPHVERATDLLRGHTHRQLRSDLGFLSRCARTHSVHTEACWSIFDLPSGRSDFVEVFGPEHENANVFPAEVGEGIVVAFAVDDIAAAREDLAAAKVELIGRLVWAHELFDDPKMEGFGGCCDRGPDENVYVIQQHNRLVET